MGFPRTDFEYRPISILAIAQVVVVIAGIFLTAAMLKLHGYGTVDLPIGHFRSEAVFVRNYGIVILCVPLIWTLLAIRSTDADKPRSLYPALLATGLILVVFGIIIFLRIALNPTLPIHWFQEV